MRTATVAAFAAVALAGCADGATPAKKAEPLGEKLGGSVASLSDCADWVDGARERQLATIADIRNIVSRDDGGIETPPLTDEEAIKMFDKACEPSYAKGFRLYVIYSRAAGFGSLVRDQK